MYHARHLDFRPISGDGHQYLTIFITWTYLDTSCLRPIPPGHPRAPKAPPGAIPQGLGCDAETMPLLSGGLGALGVVTATFLVEAPGSPGGAVCRHMWVWQRWGPNSYPIKTIPAINFFGGSF